MIIGVCDDMKVWRDMEIECLERVKDEIDEVFEYKTFESGEAVVEYQDIIDILLLDVELGGINGIETMRLLENRDNVRAILFVSGYEKYVFSAFGTKTRGFLCKPIEYEQMAREIKRVINYWNNKQYIEISTEKGLMYFDIEDIAYVCAESNYVRIFTKSENYLIYGNLKFWEERLAKYDIIRVHKSYLVNLEYVLSMQDNIMIRTREEPIPIGRRYRDTSRKLNTEYKLKKLREERAL